MNTKRKYLKQIEIIDYYINEQKEKKKKNCTYLFARQYKLFFKNKLRVREKREREDYNYEDKNLFELIPQSTYYEQTHSHACTPTFRVNTMLSRTNQAIMVMKRNTTFPRPHHISHT